MLSCLWCCTDCSVHANIPSIRTHISMSSDPMNIGSRTKYIVSLLEPLELDLGIAKKYQRGCTSTKWEIHTSCLMQWLWFDTLIHHPGRVSGMEFRVSPFSKTHVEGSVRYFKFWVIFCDFRGPHTEKPGIIPGLLIMFFALQYLRPERIWRRGAAGSSLGSRGLSRETLGSFPQTNHTRIHI